MMKRVLKKLLLGLMTFTLLIGLTVIPGCSNAAKVESNHDAVVKEILAKAREEGRAAIANSTEIEDCDVYLVGENELVYEYMYSINMDLNDDQKASLKKQIDVIMLSIFPTIKNELSIDDLNITYRFLNKDKTVAFESKYDNDIISKIKSEASNIKENIVPKSREEIEKVIKENKDVIYENMMANGNYSNFDLYLDEKNEVVFEYTFKEGLNVDKSKLDEVKKTVDNIMISSYSSMQEEFGIVDLTIVVRFLNADGTVVYKTIYDKEIVSSALG